MSAASNYLEAALLEHFRGTRLVLPTNLFIGLHTADPVDGASVTEVKTTVWPAYVRQSMGASLGAAWTGVVDEAGGGKQITNANTINFPANNGAAAVKVTHFSLWDAATGGNMWVSAPLTAEKTIDPTDIFSAIPGALRLIAR